MDLAGLATITGFKEGNRPEATLDLTPTFAGQLKSASRRFVKDGNASLLIEDKIETSDATQWVTWQMMTTADVEIVNGGAVLRKDGKQLKLMNLSHPELMVSVISLDPAPLKLDRQINGLKRLEIRIPAWKIQDNQTKIQVRLSGE